MKKLKKNKYLTSRSFLALILIFLSGILIYAWGVNKNKMAKHTSDDLKIFLNYPGSWYIQEKDFDIMISSYKTHIGENSRPDINQIKIFVDNFNAGCHPTIEENLKDPACGEGGPEVKPNEIASKEAKQLPGGTFYKYIVESPNGNKFTFFLLENGNRILQISKEPDPSQYEKEFEEIVNSIRFLDN